MLIFPESRQCLYFPSKLLTLRKTNIFRQSYLYNFCPDLQQPGKVLPICLSCNEGSKTILWYMSQSHKKTLPSTGSLLWLQKYQPSTGNEVKWVSSTDRGANFVTVLLEKEWLASTWWHESCSTVQRESQMFGQFCSGIFLEGCSRDAHEVFKLEGLNGR